MIPFNIILLTEKNSSDQTNSLSCTHQSQQLWSTVETVIHKMQYRYETLTLDRLDAQDQEAVGKVLNADLVIMVRCSLKEETEIPFAKPLSCFYRKQF